MKLEHDLATPPSAAREGTVTETAEGTGAASGRAAGGGKAGRPSRAPRAPAAGSFLRRLAVLASSVAVLASCGSPSPGSGSSAPAPAGGNTTRGVTDATVVVGGLAPLSSARGATLPGSDIGAAAYFDKVNAAGGVYGRKIVFTGVSDDGDDPATDLAAAQALVRQHGVFAIVPAITDALGSAAYLQANHVPTVGELYDPLACQKTYLFGVNGCTSPPGAERVYSPGPGLVLRQGLFRSEGARTVAVSVDDTPAGRASVTPCAGPFSSEGFKVVADDVLVPPSPPTASFGPYVQRLLSANASKPPDVVWSCNEAGTAVGMATALLGAGYHGVVYNPSTYDQRILAVPSLRSSLQGVYTYTLYAPVESNLPAVDQAKADIHASDPDAQLSFQMLAGYYAAELFVDILRRAGRHLTAERFAAAGNDNLTFDARGGVCPVTFPLAHDEGMVGGGLVQLVASSYKVVVPLACAPMSANVHF